MAPVLTELNVVDGPSLVEVFVFFTIMFIFCVAMNQIANSANQDRQGRVRRRPRPAERVPVRQGALWPLVP